MGKGTEMFKFIKSFFGIGASGELDNDLVNRILDKLKREPSEQLRAMLEPPASEQLSPEALFAARQLLDRRTRGHVPEPVYRTVPRSERVQAAREKGKVAPGFDRRLLALDVGSRVYCPWRGQHGTIIRWQDENEAEGKEETFYIRCDNGEGDWATLRNFM